MSEDRLQDHEQKCHCLLTCQSYRPQGKCYTPDTQDLTGAVLVLSSTDRVIYEILQRTFALLRNPMSSKRL